MAIRDLLSQIATDWPEYRKNTTVDKTAQVFGLVTAELPNELQKHLTGLDSLLAEGSTGAGNITAAPWIAIFDRRLTVTATTGYYVVYLYSTDLSTVTLCIAFGTTQFEKQFGSPAKAFPRMRVAATRLVEMFAHMIPAHFVTRPINLSAKPRQKLHYAYQQSAILSLPPYSLDSLPPEEQLIRQLAEIVGIYVSMVSDPLAPSVEQLVEAVIVPATTIANIEVSDFRPRPPPRKQNANGGKSRRRYSPESRKVGDAGEKVVLKYERDRLQALGRKDRVHQVRWHTQEAHFPGWDITSFDDDDREIYIEVKASAGRTISNLALTINEWNAAQNSMYRDRYYIYIVTNVLTSTPRIEKLLNPAKYVSEGLLRLNPIAFELGLAMDE